MASAAAVAANSAESPIRDDLTNPLNTEVSGTITSTEKQPAPVNAPAEEDSEDEEDDILPSNRKRPAGGAQSDISNKDDEDDLGMDDGVPAGGDDLFGSDSDEQASEGSENRGKQRKIDDSNLDSGDDEDRNERAAEDADGQASAQDNFEEINQLPAEIEACAVPEPGDDETYLMKVPKFLSFEPEPFERSTFEPPQHPHHSKKADDTFSARKVAFTTLRYRPNAANPSKLESNARILRWSDGSLTLQLATEPQTQYPLNAQNLAPPIQNAKKPTPTSAPPPRFGKPNGDVPTTAPHRPYNPSNDSFIYLSAFSQNSGIIKMTNKITTSIKVEATQDAGSSAHAKFKASMARCREKGADEVTFKATTEDPERAAKERELAWKEEEKIKKRQQRLDEKKEEGAPVRQMIGRRPGPGVGLSAAGLEGEEDAGAGRGATYTRKKTIGARSGKTVRRAKPKRRPRTGEIYSDSEEELGGRYKTKEDEYDEEDDFVAPSSEEEIIDDDGDDDEVEEEPDAEGDEDEDDAAAPPPPLRRASSGVKRRRESAGASRAGGRDEEADAVGDPDPEIRALGRTAKRRRIVDDDDEDE
ncbi:MAG: hypothetical protein M1831_005829 [Alyxoria varia]|nr:MAG: hypothetical protein M1831_005829 [Alyxoria varia]